MISRNEILEICNHSAAFLFVSKIEITAFSLLTSQQYPKYLRSSQKWRTSNAFGEEYQRFLCMFSKFSTQLVITRNTEMWRGEGV